MFEKLIDLIVQLWERIAPAEIVKAYEGGVVLRFGKYHRTVGPGLRWKWPVMEHLLTTNTCVTTQRLPPQTLTTKDDHPVVISAIIKYQIRDPKPFLLDIWDSVDVLADVTMGAIKSAVNENTYPDLVAHPIERRVVELVRKEVNKYGFQIHAVTFTDMGKVKSLRLLQGAPPANLAN
jgi:regulator of protease activity HflC (stomatin/prohibitin superfamily)